MGSIGGISEPTFSKETTRDTLLENIVWQNNQSGQYTEIYLELKRQFMLIV
jgi:hypothetical protein